MEQRKGWHGASVVVTGAEAQKTFSDAEELSVLFLNHSGFQDMV